MKYVRLWDKAFVAYDNDTFWYCCEGNMKCGKQADNVELFETIKSEGVPVKDRIFEMHIPKRLDAQGHINIAMYLGSIGNESKLI